MLLRILFLFILSYLFFVLFNWVLNRVKRHPGGRSRDSSMKAEEMVLDPQCRSYLPKGDAISRSGHYFCSEECARVFLEKAAG